MWRALIFVVALASGNVCASQLPVDAHAEENRIRQDQRIQALAQRGRLDHYRRLLGTGSVRIRAPITGTRGRPLALTAAQLAQREQAATRETAINLAAAGFTAADVTAYRKRGIDLFAVASRAEATLAGQMLMSDTIVIATAGELETGQKRADGFLSAMPFTVVRSLKGSRVAGDIVRVPRQSGPLQDGSELWVSSDIQATPGKTYLLVLSQNHYEQRMAEAHKRTEAGFNALIYSVYEVVGNGGLRPGPMHMWGRTDADPKDVESVKRDLKKYALDGHETQRSSAIRTHTRQYDCLSVVWAGKAPSHARAAA